MMYKLFVFLFPPKSGIIYNLEPRFRITIFLEINCWVRK